MRRPLLTRFGRSLESGDPVSVRFGSHLVLVGGGHAHVQVLRRWAAEPIAGVRVSVVIDRAEAVYSGMVPGFIAGEYGADDLSIDVVALASRAGAQVVLSPAVRIEPGTRRLLLRDGAWITYDVASLDVGSSVRGLELPGVREHALSTRPIGEFVTRFEERLAAARKERGNRPVRVVVVGGGAAGVEIAFTVHARLRNWGTSPSVLLLTAAERVLSGYSARVAQRFACEAHHRGIELRSRASVTAVEKGAVVVESDRVPCDLAVWATGAAPPAIAAASPVPLDADGFIRVRPTLQLVGRDDLFAVGDCAAVEGAAWMPKAGVYAVRGGPVVDANLRARLLGRPLRLYRPQRNFLTLLNLGGRCAIGTKWGMVTSGHWVWRLKDSIDRRFVRRFQVAAEASKARSVSCDSRVGSEGRPCSR